MMDFQKRIYETVKAVAPDVLVLGPDGGLLFRGDPSEAFYERAAELSAAGVWLPQTAELVGALSKAGWAVPGKPLNVGDTVVALAATPGLMERLRSQSPAFTIPSNLHLLSDGGKISYGGKTAYGGKITDGERILHTHRLSHQYRDDRSMIEALGDVSMQLVRGRFHAIAGANGAGKSTLASLLTGVLQPPRGTVFLEGTDIVQMNASALSAQVGYVFQNPEHQFVTGTVLGELAFSLSPKAGRKGVKHLTDEQRSRVEYWLERLGMLALAEASPFALSQGQKRRLSVAAMLIRGQSVLILDEPTLGQDEMQASRLMAMMNEFRLGGGTVAMITHDMRLVAEFADSLIVLSRGRPVYSGSPERFFSQPDLVEASGLAVPVLGRVCTGLREVAGTPEGLLTVGRFLSAAGTASPAKCGGRAATCCRCAPEDVTGSVRI